MSAIQTPPRNPHSANPITDVALPHQRTGRVRSCLRTAGAKSIAVWDRLVVFWRADYNVRTVDAGPGGAEMGWPGWGEGLEGRHADVDSEGAAVLWGHW
jgi:hypothetical protein